MYPSYYTTPNSSFNYYNMADIGNYVANDSSYDYNNVNDNPSTTAQNGSMYSTPSQYQYNGYNSYVYQYQYQEYDTNTYNNSIISNNSQWCAHVNNSNDYLKSPSTNTTTTNSELSSPISLVSPSSASSNESFTFPMVLEKSAANSRSCGTSGNKTKRPIKHHQLSEFAVDILNEWFDSHINHPYPTMEEKHKLSQKTSLTVKQVNSWFCNRRNRSQNTKPKRIQRQLEIEITQVYNELVYNPNKAEVIEKFRNALIVHNIEKF